MDDDCVVCVECLASSAPRKVLHVQSISLWAPSCIGPYSQASTVHGLVHCAGQIPLEAGSMVLLPGEPAWAQTIRCIESCRCVLDVHRSALRQVVGGERAAALRLSILSEVTLPEVERKASVCPLSLHPCPWEGEEEELITDSIAMVGLCVQGCFTWWRERLAHRQHKRC